MYFFSPRVIVATKDPKRIKSQKIQNAKKSQNKYIIKRLVPKFDPKSFLPNYKIVKQLFGLHKITNIVELNEARLDESSFKIYESVDPSILNGTLDIDSYLLITTDPLVFRITANTDLFLGNNYWNFSENLKMLKKLEGIVGSGQWIEAKLANYSEAKIFVLFQIEKGKLWGNKTNWISEFNKDVVKPAYLALPQRSQTSKQTGILPKKFKSVTLFYSEYPSFCQLVNKLMPAFKAKHSILKGIYFYKCIHGMKMPVRLGLEKIEAAYNQNYSDSVLFCQVHTACTINAPENSNILLKYNKLNDIFETSNWEKSGQFFLKDVGNFYGLSVPQSKEFKRIEYGHSYATLIHRIMNMKFDQSLLTFSQAGGFHGKFWQFRTRNSVTKEYFQSILRFFEGQRESLDLRIEIVESFTPSHPKYNLKAFSKPDLFRENWSALNSKNINKNTHGLSCITKLLDKLYIKDSFVHIKDWVGYLEYSILPELRLLKNATLDNVMYLPSQEYLASIYTAEQKLLAFVSGNKRRFNYSYVHNLENLRMSNPFVTFYKDPPKYLEDSIFSNKEFTYIGSEGPIFFKQLYKNLPKTINEKPQNFDTDNNTKIKILFQHYAGAYCFYATNKYRNIEEINSCLFFKSQRNTNLHSITINEVLQSIQVPKLCLLALINSCLTKDLIFFQKLEGELKNFIKNNVAFWPAKFINKNYNACDWFPLVNSENLVTGSKMSGKARKLMNLKQFQKKKINSEIELQKKNQLPSKTTISANNFKESDYIEPYVDVLALYTKKKIPNPTDGEIVQYLAASDDESSTNIETVTLQQFQIGDTARKLNKKFVPSGHSNNVKLTKATKSDTCKRKKEVKIIELANSDEDLRRMVIINLVICTQFCIFVQLFGISNYLGKRG